jgi:hypothetical protein
MILHNLGGTLKSVLAFLLLLATLPALAQSPADKFVGTWEAIVDDEPFLTLILSKRGDDITGTIIQDDFDVSDDGEITNVEPTHRKSHIESAEMFGKRLKIVPHVAAARGEKIRYLLDPPDNSELQVYLLIGGYDSPKLPPLTMKKKAGK